MLFNKQTKSNKKSVVLINKFYQIKKWYSEVQLQLGHQ